MPCPRLANLKSLPNGIHYFLLIKSVNYFSKYVLVFWIIYIFYISFHSSELRINESQINKLQINESLNYEYKFSRTD